MIQFDENCSLLNNTGHKTNTRFDVLELEFYWNATILSNISWCHNWSITRKNKEKNRCRLVNGDLLLSDTVNRIAHSRF